MCTSFDITDKLINRKIWIKQSLSINIKKFLMKYYLEYSAFRLSIFGHYGSDWDREWAV